MQNKLKIGVGSALAIAAGALLLQSSPSGLSPIELEVVKSSNRIEAVVNGWSREPAPTADLAMQMRTISAYLIGLAEEVEASLVVNPPVSPVLWPERILGGTPYADATWPYNVDIQDNIYDGGGQVLSGARSSVILIRGAGTVRNVKATESGGDGIKVLGGSNGATIENVHVYGIGHKPGAHADVLQITGGVSNLTVRGLIGDIPNNDHAPGASPVVNAGMIISSQDAPNGQIDVYGSAFYGGTFTIYNISKGSGNQIATLSFFDTDFHVNEAQGVPQFGLFQCEAKPTFVNCRVIDHATGLVLSTDPWAWDQ